MNRPPRRWAGGVLVLLAVALVTTPACGMRGLSFVEDTRLEIQAPRDRQEVELPLTVRWRVEDFQVTGRSGTATEDAGYFGVFVDRAPPPPGKALEWLARDDDVCAANPGCPDAAYLAERNAYSTSDTHFTIEELPDPTMGEARREFHEVTIVLLDGTGRRIGESAFSVEFQVEREER